MTTMAEPYFGLPQAAVRLGKLKSLSGVAIRVYVALWHDSERYSTRELIRTFAELQALVGGSPNSHKKARYELVQAGLVLAEPYGEKGYIFHLCDPETGKPWPLDPRERFRCKQKGASLVVDPKNRDRSNRSPKINSAGTSFPHGFNDPEFKAASPNCLSNGTLLAWEEVGH